MFKYFVVVTDPAYKEQIHQELQSKGGDEFVPDRAVQCLDDHPHSEYIGEFMLTPAEAEQLAKDPRVTDVHRDPLEIGAVIRKFNIQTSNFSKDTTGVVATEKNWGLVRGTSRAEPFGSNTSLVQDFGYTLDGTGVDIVFLDSGIVKYHPEFAVKADGTGGTRVVDIDWAKFGIMASNGTGSWVGDLDGHGTNVASIAAGNTNGWAKGASIYAINIIDFTNNPNTYTDPISALQTIRLFHNAKTPNKFGWRRPTVVSNSWGYELSYSGITNTFYQGNSYSNTTPNSLYGQVPTQGSAQNTAVHGFRVPAIDAEVLSCQNAGIIFVGASGNNAHKVDSVGGSDYDNYWSDGAGTRHYYHRGSTPGAADNVICVGATSQALPEHKISYSCVGPRVDIFAPGNYIMGAYINSAFAFPAVADPRSTASTSTNTTFYLNKLSGTSQATPQVAGVIACLLQARPFYNQTLVNQWVSTNSTLSSLNETYYGATTSTVYLNYASLQGGKNAQLYNPFNTPNPTTITSS